MLGDMRRMLVAGGIATAAQVVPAATWIPAVRRTLTPALLGRGRPGSVALTFDDGPHPEATSTVLAALDRLGWRATFFLLGEHVRRHRATVGDVVADGHEVAVHGDAHRYLIARRPSDVYADLRRCRDTVGDLVGAAPRWWRPTYGVLSGPALAAAAALQLRPVLWSAWGRDWRAEATPQSVVHDLFRGQVDGGTLLLHDYSASGSWRATAAALPLLAERFDAAGLSVRPLGEHLRRA